jgi:hypothetical protein
MLHTALGLQMDSAIADIKSKVAEANTEQLQLLRDSLECSENLAKLFPEDIEGNMAEMTKIASAFMNEAMHFAEEQEDPTVKAEITEELAIIYAITEAQHSEREDGSSGSFIKEGEVISHDDINDDGTISGDAHHEEPVASNPRFPEVEPTSDAEKIAWNKQWLEKEIPLHMKCAESGPTCEITGPIENGGMVSYRVLTDPTNIWVSTENHYFMWQKKELEYPYQLPGYTVHQMKVYFLEAEPDLLNWSW